MLSKAEFLLINDSSNDLNSGYTRTHYLAAGNYEFFYNLIASSHWGVYVTVKQWGTTIYEKTIETSWQTPPLDYREKTTITIPNNWNVDFWLKRPGGRGYFTVKNKATGKKVKIDNLYNLWEKIKIYLFWVLRDGSRRDGN